MWEFFFKNPVHIHISSQKGDKWFFSIKKILELNQMHKLKKSKGKKRKKKWNFNLNLRDETPFWGTGLLQCQKGFAIPWHRFCNESLLHLFADHHSSKRNLISCHFDGQILKCPISVECSVEYRSFFYIVLELRQYCPTASSKHQMRYH